MESKEEIRNELNKINREMGEWPEYKTEKFSSAFTREEIEEIHRRVNEKHRLYDRGENEGHQRNKSHNPYEDSDEEIFERLKNLYKKMGLASDFENADDSKLNIDLYKDTELFDPKGKFMGNILSELRAADILTIKEYINCEKKDFPIDRDGDSIPGKMGYNWYLALQKIIKNKYLGEDLSFDYIFKKSYKNNKEGIKEFCDDLKTLGFYKTIEKDESPEAKPNRYLDTSEYWFERRIDSDFEETISDYLNNQIDFFIPKRWRDVSPYASESGILKLPEGVNSDELNEFSMEFMLRNCGCFGSGAETGIYSSPDFRSYYLKYIDLKKEEKLNETEDYVSTIEDFKSVLKKKEKELIALLAEREKLDKEIAELKNKKAELNLGGNSHGSK